MSKTFYTRFILFSLFSFVLALGAKGQSCSFFSNGSPACGGNTGSIHLDFNTLPPATVNWTSSNGTSGSLTVLEQVAELPNLAAGDYSFTMTDAQGCVRNATATVEEHGFAATAVLVQSDCNGGATGIAFAFASGAGQTFLYNWSNSATQPTLTSLAAGSYTVTISNDLACTATATVSVPAIANPIASISGLSVICAGDQELLVASGGSTYLWSNGMTNDSLTVSPSASTTYTATVTNAGGCTATATHTITVNALPPVPVITGNPFICNGSQTILTATSAGAQEYLWSTGATGQTFIASSPFQKSTYIVTVSNAAGCRESTSVIVCRTVQFNMQVANQSCAQGSSGSITLSNLSGTAPYSFIWSPGNATQNITNVSAGTYTVTVTDATGCTSTGSAVVGQALTVFGNASPAGCGQSNGSIGAGGFNGAPPYNYLWSNNATTPNLNNLSSGSYTVTVTDHDGCTKTRTFSVTGPSPVVSISVTQASCGSNNGAITASATGGTAPYTYAWSNNQTGPGISNLSPGIYTVTVTSAAGCSTTATATISQNSPATLTLTATPVSCFGIGNGSITGNVSGSTGPFNYFWNSSATSGSGSVLNGSFLLNDLPADNYAFTVTDGSGCISTASSTVTSPNPVTASLNPQTAVCGNPTGAISLVLTGGTPNFTFIWSTGQATQNIANLSAGTYTVTVTDANGCSKTASATVSNIATPNVTINKTDPTCGLNNGMATASATGGTTPYSYIWIVGATTASVTNLPSGTYTITVTTATGCSATASVTLVGVSSMTLSTSTSNSTCGNATGSATVSATGGTPGYSYLWSASGQTSETATGLAAGLYTVTVTDAGGCTKTATAIVSNEDGPMVTVSGTNLPCFNVSSGTATAIASGGTPGYTYVWSSNQTGATLTGLSAGTITVTATDANGCTGLAMLTLTQPPALTAYITATPATCFGASNGKLTVVADGGIPPYVYTWSTTPTPNVATLTGLAAGTYTVTITDANGCSKTASNTVTQPAAIAISSNVTPVSCNGESTGNIALIVVGGTPPYTYLWSGNSGNQTGVMATGLSAGTYTVTVTDAKGCSKTGIATVTQPPTALTLSIQTQNQPCTNNFFLNATAGGGSPNYSFLWSINSSAPTITTQTPGFYSVTVTDGNGCTKTAAQLITPVLPIINTPSITPPDCGQSNGEITAVVTGGLLPYSYNWSNSQQSQTATGLSVGLYTLTVVDANGCSSVSSYTLENDLGITVGVQLSPTGCNGGTNGAIDLSISGGNGPFTFLWSNNATTEDLLNVPAGNYSVSITDAGNCKAIRSFTVAQPPGMSINAAVKNVTCPGGADGSITLSVTGGAAPYTFTWNNCQICTFSGFNLNAGTYTITITDASGCSKTASYTITAPPPLSLNADLTQACGSTTANLSSSTGGTPPLEFNWSNGVTGPLNVSNYTTTYTVTATDANGCTGTQIFLLQVIPSNQCAFFSGNVVLDENENCINDGETGLANWIVRASGQDSYYALTNVNGQYHIGVAPNDIYTIEAIPPGSYWQPCPALLLSAPLPLDTVENADLPVQDQQFCPEMEVSVSSGNLRRCFSSNYYAVHYCNNGTATADNAYIVLSMDAFSTPLSSSIPYTSLGNNNFRFNIGDVDPGECNQFNVYFKINCNAVVGQSVCVTAHAYPDSTCTPPNGLWSGASLAMSSSCTADSLHFTIKNVGFGAMSKALDYIVVEDHVMRSISPIQLSPNQSHIVTVPANGSTWRVAIPQEEYHPGSSMPSLTVEACTQNASFSTGFVNQFAPDDADPWIDVLCKAITASLDPNDKEGLPKGYGNLHYIDKGLAIDYHIRFQNTGNDTAFRVQVIDTLSSWLDPATIRPGASSHPYHFDLSGKGVASFTFDNILLPDSTTNEPESHGFVQFSIFPRADVANETVIQNQAAIYFDFNEPVYTNTSWHRIGDHFITVGFWQPERPEYALKLSPNPSSGLVNISVEGLRSSESLRIQLLDQLGRVVLESQSGIGENSLNFDCKNLIPAMYWFEIRQDGKPVGRGKLVRE